MKRRTLTTLSALMLIMTAALLLVAPAAGQTTTTTPTPAATTTGPSNETQVNFIACDTRAVLNATGVSLVGWDLYYQVFSAANATGTALTGIRQVAVAGEYSVSDTVTYTGGTLAAAVTGSARVWVGRESDSATVDFEFTVNDVQDGCADPENAPTTATDVGGTTGVTTTSNALYGVGRGILGPNGTVLNSNLLTEAEVVIGARQTDRYRSDTPGLIFAECDAFPLAEPGLVYDSDSVTIFWSWYTKTLDQMTEHLNAAVYNVRLNTANLPMTQRSEPVRRDGNYWVFYTATVGNLRPGHYEVGYDLTWTQVVNDGYSDYGPGTSNPASRGLCNFDVLPNPDGTSVVYTGLYFPTTGPVHNINTD
ncbi:MAG: hypothetical protein IPK19_40525 [Chloroflexi bacterium]|nr:hypothetical protein [Chloroflexota bacterium]